ncbi:MAG: MerR family DNA-binding transcriptional regulator [Bacteroidota bacterium]
MTIGALAKATGASIDTIRFYERRGLLPRPRRTAGGFRDYDAGAEVRLAAIARAKALGFTLEEILTLLHLADAPEADAQAVRDAAADRLDETERALADLTRRRDALAQLVATCGGPETSREACPILEEILV